MKRLENKVAIVTGGSTGLGEATCHRFAEEGAKVAIFDVSAETGAKVAESIKSKGGIAEFHRVDVSNEKEVAPAVAKVTETWGGLHVMVNNAAVTGVNKFAHEIDVEDWDRIFSINVRGVFLCTKHALKPMMAAKSGAIVNIASIYGLIGSDDLQSYHATKGAVVTMTKTDAISYAPLGIRVNGVCPGSVKTPLFLAAGDTFPGGREAYLAQMKIKHPLCLGEPVDIANCVLFLASDEARFVTGAMLVADGGYTAQ